jgi:hypothetical protein
MPNPAQLPDPRHTETYQTIASRLAALSPSIYIDHFIQSKDPSKPHGPSTLMAGRTTLLGIGFVPKSADALKHALRQVTDFRGNQFFAEGSSADPAHWDNLGDPTNWPLRLSFMATKGVGFRQIWRPHLRGLQLADAQTSRAPLAWDRRFNGQFNAPVSSPLDSAIDNDQTSLHCAIAPQWCNIHIDEMGFVLTGPDGKPFVGPDFGQHTVNELLFKSDLEGKLPDSIIDRMSLELPNSTNGYSRVGISGDIAKTRNFLFRGTASCSVLPPFDCSVAISLSGSTDFLGGGR